MWRAERGDMPGSCCPCKEELTWSNSRKNARSSAEVLDIIPYCRKRSFPSKEEPMKWTAAFVQVALYRCSANKSQVPPLQIHHGAVTRGMFRWAISGSHLESDRSQVTGAPSPSLWGRVELWLCLCSVEPQSVSISLASYPSMTRKLCQFQMADQKCSS